MSSIKKKLLTTFFTIIAILLISEAFFIATDYIVLSKYMSLTSNMISEYKLIGNTSALLFSLDNRIKSPTDVSEINNYNLIYAETKNILAKLNGTIVGYESRIAFGGLENNINEVFYNLEISISNLNRGDYLEAVNYHDMGHEKNSFVRENATNLLLKELEYAKNLQVEIDKVRLMSRLIGIILLVMTVLGCLWYAITFSKKLISPLLKLTKLAKVIEGGNLNAAVDTNLLKVNDEVGSLANSFNTMVLSLRSNISKLQESLDTLSKAKITISQLKEVDRLKNEVLNIATHELKTPLISIVGLSEVMSKQPKTIPTDYQSYISIIHDEGTKLSNLIKTMLTASRNEIGKEASVKEKFELVALVNSLKTSLSMLTKRTDSQVKFDLRAKELNIESDKNKISQVIYNFVDNAVKYGPKNQVIGVNLFLPDKKSVRVEVKGDGQGISKVMQKKLFMKFSQLEPSLSRSQDGMGLGLYICKQNIENLGGQIGVESEPGKGATFYFTLPLI